MTTTNPYMIDANLIEASEVSTGLETEGRRTTEEDYFAAKHHLQPAVPSVEANPYMVKENLSSTTIDSKDLVRRILQEKKSKLVAPTGLVPPLVSSPYLDPKPTELEQQYVDAGIQPPAREYLEQDEPEEVSLVEAFKKGRAESILGKLTGLKEKGFEERPTIKQRAAFGAGVYLHDAPLYFLGSALGGGGILGAAGAFALPSGVHKVIDDKKKDDLGEKFAGAIKETGKGWLTGLTVGSVGKLMPKGLKYPTEAGALATVPALLEARLPGRDDVIDALVLLGILKGARFSGKVLDSGLTSVGLNKKGAYAKLHTEMSDHIHKTNSYGLSKAEADYIADILIKKSAGDVSVENLTVKELWSGIKTVRERKGKWTEARAETEETKQESVRQFLLTAPKGRTVEEFVSKKGNVYTKTDDVWYTPDGKKLTNKYAISAAEKGKTTRIISEAEEAKTKAEAELEQEPDIDEAVKAAVAKEHPELSEEFNRIYDKQKTAGQEDRRQDITTRTKLEAMTREEMMVELHTDKLTGLKNRRAYEDLEKEPIQASIDIDSLKAVNDTYGHAAGDLMIQTVGEALRSDKSIHISGDEFIVQGKTKVEVKAVIDKANKYLEKHPLEVVDEAGNKVSIPIGFSHGIGKTLKLAETGMKADKASRSKLGLRAERGETPVGLKVEKKIKEKVEEIPPVFEKMPEVELKKQADYGVEGAKREVERRAVEAEKVAERSKIDLAAEKEKEAATRLLPAIRIDGKVHVAEFPDGTTHSMIWSSLAEGELKGAKKIESGWVKPDGTGFSKAPEKDILYSGFDPTQLVTNLKGLTKNIKEAIPYLKGLGNKVYEAKDDFYSWKKKMQTHLGDMWNTFKSKMQEIWKAVKAWNEKLGERGSIGREIDKYLGILSTRLGNIDPSIKYKVRKYIYTTGQKVSQRKIRVKPFIKKVHTMSAVDKAAFDIARKNGDGVELKRLVIKYKLGKEYHEMRNVLDELYNDARAVGYRFRRTPNYHPREIKDVAKFLDYLYGTDAWSTIDRLIKTKEVKLQRYMTEEEKVKLINSLLRGYSSQGLNLSKPGQFKLRKVKKITPELDKFYRSSDSALLRYIDDITNAVETHRLFGKKLLKQSPELKDTLGGYVLRVVEEKKLTPSQERDLRSILESLFNPSGPSRIVNAYRSISYIDTMGSPVTAITQIGDTAWSLYNSGFYETGKAVAKSLVRQQKFTKKDLGVAKIAAEFSDLSVLAKALDATFYAVGLTGIDAIGKEALINSAYAKAIKQASNPKTVDILRKRLQPIFGEETNQVIKDFQTGNITENVKLYLFDVLSDYQPITLLEMPQKYVDGGNGRIFYMLKSYTIKMFDVYRRECFQKIKTPGTRLEGLKNLIKLSAYLIAMNATADVIQDLMLGRPVELADLVVDNIYRLGGASRFTVSNIKRQGVGTGLLLQILPPAKFINALGVDIRTAGDEKGLEITQSIPLVGKLYYWWFGKGAKKLAKKKRTASAPKKVKSLKSKNVLRTYKKF